MDYNFPIITHIEQVKKAIEGYDEFRITDKGDYIVVNYAVAFENTFYLEDINDINGIIRRECRGLIFDPDGNLISRPYHKFFNVGERKETLIENINFSHLHVILEKLDGSMIRPIPTSFGFRLATKAGVTDVAMNAEVFIADKPKYSRFIHNCIERGLTPIFEWCSRKNRIVVDYPEDQLILTAIRNTKTGVYSRYNYLCRLHENYGIPIIKKFSEWGTISQVIDDVRKFDKDEGVVVRFDNGHMIKIKADEYVLRHKSKDAISVEKNIIEVILNDTVDDLIPLLTEEDAKRVKEFQHRFWDGVDRMCKEMEDLFNSGVIVYPDRKDFAVKFVQSQILPIHAPIMYGLWQKKPCKDIFIELIRKSLTSQTKIDNNRWLWGGFVWNV